MNRMPKPNRWTLSFYGETLICEPDNWRDIELALSRSSDSHGVNKSFTSDFVFSRNVASALRNLDALYGKSTVCTITFEKRQNDWSYKLFSVMSADFSTFEYENGVVTLSFIENSVRKLIDDNKGTDYDIPLNEGKILSYTGINLNQSNKISGITGSCWEIKTGESYVINGMRSTSAFSSNFNFYDSNDQPYQYS